MGNDQRKRSTKTYNPDTGKEGLGQNGLYWKLMHRVALHRRALGEKRSVSKLKDEQHLLLQLAFNFIVPFPDLPHLRTPKGTHDMSVTEFSLYYTQCEDACLKMYGIKVSPFGEDSLEFDHGGG